MPTTVEQGTGTRLVCHCRKVPYEAVEATIDAGKARSVADLQRTTTACTHCFGCRFELERILSDRLGDDFERSALTVRPEDEAGGLRERIARLLGRSTAMPPKRMYLPILEGFAGSDVRTRVALFHWHDADERPDPIGFRADLMALDGTRLAIREGEVAPGETEVIEISDMVAGLPGGAGTLKVVLDADRVMSLRPYFHWITPNGITSTHEKGAPRLGRITKPRTYHWVFPSGYADRPSHAYFFMTNALLDPLAGHELIWRSQTGEEIAIPVDSLELDQSACVPLHEAFPALANGSEPGTVRLSPASHVAGFIVRHDPEADLWRVQHL